MNVITPAWFKYDGDVWMSFGEALEMYHTFTPKVAYLKTLKRNACILDIGAGDGSITVFRDWLKPARRDLKYFAYALEKGCNFDSYDGYEIGRWPSVKPNFNDVKFDAIFTSHFIEHIEDPVCFVKWCMSRLNQNGRLYLEWPSAPSILQPQNSEFQRDGIPLIISNYRDDSTHQRDIPDKVSVREALINEGALIDQEGTITNPYFEEELRAHFRQKCENKTALTGEDKVALTFAYWSKSRWAQYIIATNCRSSEEGRN